MKFLLFSLLILFISLTSTSQTVINTKSGQKFLMYEDGQWETITEDLDSSDVNKEKLRDGIYTIPKTEHTEINDNQLSKLKQVEKEIASKEIDFLVKLIKAEDDYKLLTLAKAEPNVLKLKKEETKTFKENYKQSTKFLKRIKSLYELDPLKFDKKFIDLKEEIDIAFNSNLSGDQSQSKSSFTTNTISNYTTEFNRDVTMYPREPYQCELVFDGKDPVTGKKKKEVSKGILFTYTQEKLKPYFKEEDFMICESYLTEVGSNNYLTLDIRLKSKDANRNYGYIPSDEIVKIEFIDGSKIIGNSIFLVEGEIEPYSGHTLFSSTYLVDKEDIKALKKGFVDNIGIMWSSGYEEYEVYKVDFLMNQAKCLTR